MKAFQDEHAVDYADRFRGRQIWQHGSLEMETTRCGLTEIEGIFMLKKGPKDPK